ncbi:MAG: Phenylacetic acid degradation-related protein [Proteobacteria bacterium]|nr:Phenylacetic acid degradation-related protein [Pseudomonadota bacterium]
MPDTTLPPRRSDAEQIRLETLLREMFEHSICFNELLGFQVSSLAPAAPSLSFAMRPDLVGHYLHGRLHGGVIASVLDTVAGLAVTVGIAEKFNNESAEQVAHRFARVGTIDLRTDYLHQGIGKKFIATGRLTRLGGRIASVQMTLENEAGLLIATGCASYVIS